MSYDLALPLILIFSVGSLFVAGYLASWVLKRDTGTDRDAGDLERHQGGRRGVPPAPEPHDRHAGRPPRGRDLRALRVRPRRTTTSTRSRPRCVSPFWTTLSFVLGAACSVIAGYVGMWVSIRTNIRTASAARTSLNDALRTALRGGAVSGLFVVAMSLFGVGGLYWLVRRLHGGPAGADSAADRRLRLRRVASSRSSPSSAAASTRRPPTSAPTSSARSRPGSPRTTRATPPSSRTSSATTSATAPAAAPTSSSRRRPRTSAR